VLQCFNGHNGRNCSNGELWEMGSECGYNFYDDCRVAGSQASGGSDMSVANRMLLLFRAAGGFTHGMTHGDSSKEGRHGDIGLEIVRQGLDTLNFMMFSKIRMSCIIRKMNILKLLGTNRPD